MLACRDLYNQTLCGHWTSCQVTEVVVYGLTFGILLQYEVTVLQGIVGLGEGWIIAVLVLRG